MPTAPPETELRVPSTPARTLVRGLQLLELVAAPGEPNGVGVTELATRAGLDKGTASRLLRTLREHGYVRQRPTDRRYVLGSKVLRIAQGFDPRLLDLRSVARPHLSHLRDQSRETVHLAVREGDEVLSIDVLESDQSVRVGTALGRHWDLRVTAMGRAVLGALRPAEREAALSRLASEPVVNGADLHDLEDEIHRAERHGWASVTRNDEVVRVGAAIIGGDGSPIGAISLSGPSYRVHSLNQFGSLCTATARQIENDLDVHDDHTTQDLGDI